MQERNILLIWKWKQGESKTASEVVQLQNVVRNLEERKKSLVESPPVGTLNSENKSSSCCCLHKRKVEGERDPFTQPEWRVSLQMTVTGKNKTEKVLK